MSLVAEALAQAILLVSPPADVSSLRLVAVDAARILQPLEAGDRVEVEAHEIGRFGPLRRYACRAVLSGALAAVAEITVSS
ncbi:MAG: hypothetical protein ACOY3Y_05980 [Acidobacteriota bacterium]